MKGFVFTLDALFSLMIASAGISVLFYFIYTAPNPYFIQYSFASGLVSRLASTPLNAISNLSLVSDISQQQAASNQTWPMSQGNQHNNGGNNYGPSALTLDHVFAATAPIINGTIVSNYGNVYFGAGNVVYAVNISTGSVAWTSNVPYNPLLVRAPYVNATLLYGGMLIYATAANVVALNAYNGTAVWSTNTMYAVSGEPNGYESKMKLIQYNGKIITYTYDSSNPTSSLMYSIYANNGTVAGAAPLYSNAIQYIAISNGQLVFTTSNNKVTMATQILNSTYDAGTVWSISPTCGGFIYPTGLTTYSNFIAFGCGTYGNVINTNSNFVSSLSYASPVYGVSSYGGHMVFQMGDQIALATATSNLWTQGMGAYGTAINNATPVISSQDVYSLWSNNYLVMQNLSTGSIIASTQIPYPGSLNPYMALAYGRLFVSKGQYLMEFGSCAVNPNTSILSALGTLYLNGRGGCADYLLNRLQSNSNIAVTLAGSSVQSAAQFNGQSSYIISPAAVPNGISSMAITLWMYPASNPAATTLPFTDEWTQQISWFNSQIGGTTNGGNWAYSNSLSPNSWYFVALTGTSAGGVLYVNGQVANVLSGAPAHESSNAYFGGSSESGGPGCCGYNFNGMISDVQIYDTSLSAAQVSQLYREGITGAPISTASLVGWWPLQGDANNYAGTFSAGYPTNIVFNSIIYNSTTLQNAFSITSQSVPVPILNYSTGKYKLYNMGVYSWK